MSSLTDIDPRDARVVSSARHFAAVRYIDQHADLYLDDEKLLEACAVELVANHGICDPFTAHAVAVSALAEVQARTRPAWIDISLSTSHVCRVVNPVSGKVATFTASELIRIAEERAQERSDAPPEAATARDTRCIN